MPHEGEYISRNTAQKIGENYNADYIFHVILNDLSSNKRSVVVPYVNMERKKTVALIHAVLIQAKTGKVVWSKNIHSKIRTLNLNTNVIKNANVGMQSDDLSIREQNILVHLAEDTCKEIEKAIKNHEIKFDGGRLSQ